MVSIINDISTGKIHIVEKIVNPFNGFRCPGLNLLFQEKEMYNECTALTIYGTIFSKYDTAFRNKKMSYNI